ncbi:MAG TPA: fasciclin domain-containing protein [Catenuloplanes sp.]|jgi:uncharacterized surface protein with fasciclin (FAS1) repeats
MRTTKFAAFGAAALFALSLTACGGTETPAATTPAAPAAAPTTPAASPSAVTAQAEFGAACSAVPTDASNPGSFDAMSKEPVATAASGNPLLSTLVTAVKKANLVDTLNTAPAITVFAPVNDAFGKIPKGDLDKVLADNKTLTSVLTYHVVQGKIAPEQLAGTHKTLQGGEVTVAGSGSDYKVNGESMVICGNVQTANATVYLLDTVLMPKS